MRPAALLFLINLFSFLKMNSSKLIVIDGPDGSGKTTATQHIIAAMRSRGVDIECVNILSGEPSSLALRTVFLSHDTNLSARSELLLLGAIIQNTMDTVVTPLLLNGKSVLIDRGPLSTFAYQLGAHAQLREVQLLDKIFEEFAADETLLVFTEPEVSMQRCAARGELDRMEARGIQHYKAIYNAYKMAQSGMRFGPFFNRIMGRVHEINNDGGEAEFAINCQNFVDTVAPHTGKQG